MVRGISDGCSLKFFSCLSVEMAALAASIFAPMFLERMLFPPPPPHPPPMPAPPPPVPGSDETVLIIAIGAAVVLVVILKGKG